MFFLRLTLTRMPQANISDVDVDCRSRISQIKLILHLIDHKNQPQTKKEFGHHSFCTALSTISRMNASTVTVHIHIHRRARAPGYIEFSFWILRQCRAHNKPSIRTQLSQVVN